jgi:hypothetical protein
VVVQTQTDLFEVVRALEPGRGLANLLNSRKQQPYENGENRDHHEQLDERER